MAAVAAVPRQLARGRAARRGSTGQSCASIEQLWGSARALLGLGDLARLRGEHGIAREHYLEALAILREVGARPEIARCLAGLGRIALEQGTWRRPASIWPRACG